jgi:hypothetical protein
MNITYITLGIILLLLILILLAIKLKTKKDKKPIIRLVNPKDINTNILIKLAKYEKFIYLHGFTRRVLLVYIQKKRLYKAYYYNLLNGVHLFLEIDSNNKDFKINYTFLTRYNELQFITCNTPVIKFEDSNSIIEEYKDYSLQELYNAHLNSREKIKKDIIYKRLSPKELVQNSTSDIKDNKKSYSPIFFKLILLITLLISIFYYYKKLDINKPIKNPNRELLEFTKKCNNYKLLTTSKADLKNRPLKASLKSIDNYLKKSNILREINEPAKGAFNQDILPCKLPNNIISLYNWHNGIEKFIPFEEFYSNNQMVANYSKFNKKSKSNFIILFGNKNGYKGLSYNCKDGGIYRYNAKTKNAANKEFYNINHFLAIISKAYETKAFYDDNNYININMKEYLKIYRNNLSKKDKKRYNNYLTYIKNKASLYKKYGNSKLKLALLTQIDRLYEPKLLNVVTQYLNSSNKQIKIKAINIIGKIGTKKYISKLKPFLKSKNSQIKDFTLLAIANLANKNDSYIAKDIYPLLDDKSVFVRLSAYKVLEKIEDKNSLRLLREKFKKEDIKVKIGIIRAIAKIGTKDDIKLLTNYLKKIPPINPNIKYSEYIRGTKPNPIILNYEITNAIKTIISKQNNEYWISAKY